jgi:hypothetical protein
MRGLVEATASDDCEVGELCCGHFDLLEHFKESGFISNDYYHVSVDRSSVSRGDRRTSVASVTVFVCEAQSSKGVTPSGSEEGNGRAVRHDGCV